MKKIVLCILDGVGIRNEKHGNAFLEAYKPNFDYIYDNYPNCLLEASGIDVGLPINQMGNSEVGHMNIGAGRIVYQPLQFINEAIKDGNFYENKEFLDVIDHVVKNNSKLHLFGLLSDGGVHSHIEHLYALINLLKEKNIKNVYLHLFLDGRDTLPDVAMNYLNSLNAKLGDYKISTIMGRYYGMDRDNRYERVFKAYDAVVNGVGNSYKTFEELISDNYSKGIKDEFVVPGVLNYDGLVEKNDGMILFNFRPDRARELFSALTNENFDGFKRDFIKGLKLVTMMPVSDEVICTNAFNLKELNNTLGEYLSSKGLSQLRIAETEKYAHVTYFFDGGVEKELENCKRILIPSSKVATYDLKPEMSAYEVTDTLLKEINDVDVVILNFANGDMVGHTGNFEATKKAVETIDSCLKKINDKVNELDGHLIITADHGNSDLMIDDNDNIITSHSTSKVPFVITNNQLLLKNGRLSDIAPTILDLLDIPKPIEMTGESLLQK